MRTRLKSTGNIKKGSRKAKLDENIFEVTLNVCGVEILIRGENCSNKRTLLHYFQLVHEQ